MENKDLKIAKELLKVAKELIADKDYQYIYDPDHKKHPGGGYEKTEKGWQKGKQDKAEQKSKESTPAKKSKWKAKVQGLSEKAKSKMAQDTNCPSKILDELVEKADANDDIIYNLLNNKKLSTGNVFDIANKYNQEDTCYVANEIVNHKSMGRDDLVELFENNSNLDIQAAICGSKKTPSSFLKK